MASFFITLHNERSVLNYVFNRYFVNYYVELYSRYAMERYW